MAFRSTANREQLKWFNIEATDLPAATRKALDVVVSAETQFKADLEALLTKEGIMPKDTKMLLSRRGSRIGVAFSNGSANGGLKFKTR